jgi:CubicO group peptidase (beta-lactamase class C family)
MSHPIKQLLSMTDIPGISIAYIEDALVSESWYVGEANTDTQAPITHETIHQAASLSKPIFAYLALNAAVAGAIDLDLAIGESLDLSEANLRAITPRQILSHTSGLPNWLPDLPERLAQQDVYLAPASADLTAPGQFFYSGEGYFLLQRVLEHLTGKSLSDYAHDALFSVLELEKTAFVWPSQHRPSIAFEHDDQNRPSGLSARATFHQYANAAASLYTTATDYATMLCHFMSAPDPANALMREPHIGLTDRISWTLGWGCETDEKNHPWYWHHGRAGHTNFAIWAPEARTGLVVMCNTKRSRDAETLFRSLVEVTLGTSLSLFDLIPYEELKRRGLVR